MTLLLNPLPLSCPLAFPFPPMDSTLDLDLVNSPYHLFVGGKELANLLLSFRLHLLARLFHQIRAQPSWSSSADRTFPRLLECRLPISFSVHAEQLLDRDTDHGFYLVILSLHPP
ncbi:uncharacterized protein C8R40DRAFT_126452 [Lentinula edodes]|uniref:uncharacterized protein n=1 Tax=Lentinula edodes TaxID=5353 RepID=UPI001E8DC17D|nr:uncharacterized protein C8R40DRAFT_126452 [Lentinula edodes]KAH7876306.1 hypothetical protein C8R40DRAFT_126452 [Lentinula edodes]